MPLLLRSVCQICCLCLALTALAAPYQAQKTVWGLFYRNYFSVETTIDRTTTITIDDGAPVVTSSREVVLVRYEVRRLRPTEVTLDAIIVKCRRVPLTTPLGAASTAETTDETDDPATRNLENLRFEIRVSPDGGLNGIQVPPEMARQLDGGSQSAQSILRSTLPEATIASWLARPFWMTVEDDKFAAEAEWQQIDEVSLGLMGQIRTLVTCRIDDIAEQKATVTITGKSRHITPARFSRSSGTLAFQDVKMESSEFAGTAVMIRRGEIIDERTEQPRQRPWLESMKLNWTVKGTAVASVNGSEKAVAFSQKRTESARILPDFYVGDQPLFRAPRELQIPR